MGNDISKGTTYATGGTGGQGVITSANLNAHVDDATIKPTFISLKTQKTSLVSGDQFLLESSGSLYRTLWSTLLTSITAVSNTLVPIGSVIQTVSATPYTANANLGVIPNDDTIPQITEGTQILTLNISPQFSTSQIRLTFSGFGAVDTLGNTLSAALFRAGTTDCLQATTALMAIAGQRANLPLNWVDSPATTSSVTYSIRAGPDGGVGRMNGGASSRVFGGKAACTLVAQEIKA